MRRIIVALAGEGHLRRRRQQERVVKAGERLRVVAWWSVYVQLGSYSKRRLRARPLRALEAALGHRLHVTGIRPDNNCKGLYLFDAFSSIAADSVDHAVVAIIQQMQSLARPLEYLHYPLNRTPDKSEDPDDRVIAAFYWESLEHLAQGQYGSSGVQLYLPTWSEDRWLRPMNIRTVGLPDASRVRSDYVIDFDVNISGTDKADLIDSHWPKFRSRWFTDDVELIEVVERPSIGWPNKLTVRRVLHDVPEDEAVCICLATDTGFNITLEHGNKFKLIGRRRTNDGNAIAAFTLTRSPPSAAS
jgi:hypothetical protein